MNTNFKLSKETEEEMISLIQEYFSQEKGEELGNLEAMLLLNFFSEKIAPYFYNQAVDDCHTYITEKAGDMFELEK